MHNDIFEEQTYSGNKFFTSVVTEVFVQSCIKYEVSRYVF